MEALFSQILSAAADGQAVVLCIILAASGSVPRGAGAKMAVFADGSIAGTIGGGNVEYLAIQKAMEVHRTGEAACQSYALHPNEVQDIGMVCGGAVTVYFYRFTRKDEALLRRILELSQENRNSWLIFALAQGRICEIGIWDACDGRFGAESVPEAVLFPLLQEQPVYWEGACALYVEPLSRRGMVYIFGGGHVGAALCPVLTALEFRVCIVESRPALCAPARFPGAVKLLQNDCTDILGTIPITEDDYIAIMTPGHALDRCVLNQVLHTPARYIGLIGSRKKLAATYAYLLEQGHEQAQLDRIHAPIGLDIGAQTPQEIAVSIAAQLIAERAGRDSYVRWNR